MWLQIIYKERMPMKIPNDTGHPWRLDKFVEYQHKVPPIHPIHVCEYSRMKNLSKDDNVILSWFVSMTYCEITSIFLFEQIDWNKVTENELERFWIENKPKLIFGSARKYVKANNKFVNLVLEFLELTKGKPYEWLLSFKSNEPVDTYEGIIKAVKKLGYVGRFAADLFLEMVVAYSKYGMFDLKLHEPEELDWKHCANLTSGLFNILYMDEEADLYDKTGKVAEEHIPLLNDKIRMVQRTIQDRYPEQDSSLPLVIGKICSFRNLFKSARYGGFHHDRQLGNLKKYEESYPEHSTTWKDMYLIRSNMHNHNLLGELGGWNGIRKERKKLFVNKGLTGVEEITDAEGEPELNEFDMKRRLLELELRVVDLEEMVVKLSNQNVYQEPVFDGIFQPQPEPEKPLTQPDPKATVEKEEDEETPEPQPNTESKSIAKLVAEQLAREAEDDEEEIDPELEPEDEFEEEGDYETKKKPSSLEDFINSKLNDSEDDEESVEEEEETESHTTVTPKPATRSFSKLLSDAEEEAEDEQNKQQEEEEEVRKPIKSESKDKMFIAAPYGGNRVDKTLGDKIKAVANDIEEVYFPLEPFHYRESKRHGTQFALEGCLEKKLPVSMETRREIPEWAIEMLSSMDSEVRIHLNTLDKKKWRMLYPTKKAADPEELIKTFADCYNAGIYTILKISPIVPGIISKKDVLEVVDRLKNWTPIVEICFASFTTEEFAELKGKMKHDDFYAIKEYYFQYEDTDIWYVKDDYREQFLQLLHSFVTGSKIEFKILNEAKFDGESVEMIKF